MLVDGMRGRSSLWYRVRVNLTHVPESDRPEQEPLEVDYDPWAEYAFPDRAGQLERAPRKPRSRADGAPDADAESGAGPDAGGADAGGADASGAEAGGAEAEAGPAAGQT